MIDLVPAIAHINLSAITVLELTKRIRLHSGWSLSVSLPIARALKEAYRLGEIRGRIVK